MARLVISLAFLLAIALPGAFAQDRVARVAIVANTIPLDQWSARSLDDGTPHAGSAIRDGLEKLGWIDGKNIRIIWRSAEGRYERLVPIFQEVSAAPVDVIVAIGPGAGAAAKATRTVPVVMAVSAPVMGPFLKSLSRPDRNFTGLSFEAGELEGKRLEILKRAVPAAKRIALLEEEGACSSASNHLKDVSTRLGVVLVPIRFKSMEQLENAFIEAAQAQAQAVLVCDGVYVWRYGYQRAINDLALKHRLPTMHTAEGGADNGGLMAYGIDMMVQYRRVPYYIDRILKGASPADLPIEQPNSLRLVINQKTARALGITMPPDLLVQADRVIE